jgi:acyl carrier protein
MTRAQVKQAVLDALLTVVPEARPAEIDPAAPIRDQLDIDSMDFINFVATLDQTLGVDVPEADYGRLATLDACVDYLAGRLGVPATTP